MDSYHRVLATVCFEQPDRPPMDIMATGAVFKSLEAHLCAGNREELLSLLGVDFRPFGLGINKKQPIPDSVINKFGPKGLFTTPYGVVLKREEKFPQAHRVWGPFYDTDDLDSFDWPNKRDMDPPETIAQQVSIANEKGLCTVARCNNPVKFAYFMRPFDEFLVDCVQRPQYVRELLERIADIEFTCAEYGIKAGCRAAMVFGDFADQRSLMFSPATFRTVLKPILAGLVDRVRGIRPDVLVFLHSDGNLSEVLDDLVDCGFDAVHPIQPECMDMQEVKRLYHGRLTIFGGVSVQTELPRSTPEQVRKLVRSRVDSLGAGGGFILAPSNTILPDCPLESIVAMYDECRQVK